jgi:hypothetical protein
MRLRLPLSRRDMMAFGLTVVVGATTAAAITVSAADGDGDAVKRKPPRDAPGAVQAADLPAGERLTTLANPRMHGGLRVVPPGHTQQLQDKLDALPATKSTFERVSADSNDTAAVGISLDRRPLPAGYKVTAGAGVKRTDENGTSEIVEAGLTLEGTGFPITVLRWIPPAALVGEPLEVGAWMEGHVMTTLGEIRGVPAVFVHRRTGVKSSELQQVWMTDGKYAILVEGYVDEFAKLVRVAEALLVGSGRVR